MKVIDLLNKIANWEEVPKKIKRQWVYEYKYDDIRDKYTYMQNTGERFDDDWLICEILNDEVEIIEEEKKIPKKLVGEDKGHYIDYSVCNIVEKINEIIDYLDYLKSKGDE